MSLLNIMNEPRPYTRRVDHELDELKRCLRRGRRETFAEVLTLTPSCAAFAMRANPDNRKQKRARINAIKDKVENRGFKLNGETVIFSKCGYLNDGQNRLQAVLESGVPIRSFVAFGLDRETRDSIDSEQTARSASDILHMSGIGNSEAVSAVASVLCAIERRGSYVPGKGNDKNDVAKYGKDHGDEIVRALGLVSKKDAKGLLNQATMCAMFILFSRKDSEDAHEFIEKLLTGVGLEATSPILVLRNRVLALRREKGKDFGRKEYNDMMQLMIRAWNHWRAGTTCKQLRVENDWPDIE
jgi:hypothetical protein